MLFYSLKIYTKTIIRLRRIISEFGKPNANATATSTINLLGLGRVREIISTVPPKFEFGKCYVSEHGRYGKQRRNSRYIVNIAYNNGRLSDVQLLCLEDELKRNDFAQSNFPYNIYAPFNWESYDEVTCQHELRFEKATLIFYAFKAVYKSQTK
jgi:hypothetical protein